VIRVYRGDHTAHLRRQFKTLATYFAAGLAVAVCAAIANAVITTRLDGYPYWLIALWGLNIALAVVAALGLALTAVLFLIYLWRRPELDAAGAEVVGEAYARLHAARKDEQR
jgi:hypothetical protein